MTLLEELAALLHDLGVGVYNPNGTDSTVFTTLLPDGPDIPETVMAVARYGGPESSLADDYDEPSIQVRVRGPAADNRVAEAQAELVYDRLHGLGARDLADGTWLQLCVAVQSGPVYIGPDSVGRHEYVINFRAEVSRTGTNRSS